MSGERGTLEKVTTNTAAEAGPSSLTAILHHHWVGSPREGGFLRLLWAGHWRVGMLVHSLAGNGATHLGVRPSPVPSSPSFLSQETPPVAPEPTGTSTGDSLPGPDHSSATWGCESELSKPGRLVSHIDSEPFSGCSADLALSCSKSLGTGPDNAPEENEYQSMDSIRIQVAQDPSVDLMEGGLRPPAAPQPPGREEVVPVGSIAPLLGAAAAGVLLAMLFAVLYRRRV